MQSVKWCCCHRWMLRDAQCQVHLAAKLLAMRSALQRQLPEGGWQSACNAMARMASVSVTLLMTMALTFRQDWWLPACWAGVGVGVGVGW